MSETPTPTRGRFVSASALAVAIAAMGTSLSNQAVELPPVDFYTLEIPQEQTGSDITPALIGSIAACENETHASDREGCRVRIPAGEHRITETIVICRATEFFGDGGSGRENMTRVSVAPNVTAFRIGSVEECAARGEGFAGGWSRLRSMTLVSEACENEPGGCVPHFGVNMHAQAHLEDIYIRGFTQGVRISADITRANLCDGTDADCKTNANSWSMTRVRIEACDHAGVYAKGGDANAGLALLVNATGNCQNPAPYDELWGDCANLVDESFLGNTWIASHTSAVNATVHTHPGYISRGNTQRTLWLGAYSENNQDRSQLSQNSMAIGGLSGWTYDSPGIRMDGRNWYGQFIVNSDVETPDETRLVFGTQNPPGTAWAFSSVQFGHSKPLRLRVLGSNYVLDRAALGIGRVMRFAGDPASSYVSQFRGQIVAP